jgi:hypothetical protein
MAGKPKVTVDKDGDGDVDVEVEIDNPGAWPAGVRDEITALIARMEVRVVPPATRITYQAAREVLRGLLTHNP